MDGDIVLHKAAFACEKVWRKVYVKGMEFAGDITRYAYKKELDEYLQLSNLTNDDITIEEEITSEPIENAIYLCKTLLENIQGNTNATQMRIFLSDTTTFRHRIATDYKCNRKRRPLLKEEIKNYLLKHWGAEIEPDLEADDCLGIYEGIKASIDKDLLMLPGRHYNIDKKTLGSITPSEGAKRFYAQVLTGDPTDNIKGLPGVGPKTAEKLLNGFNIADMITLVYNSYKKQYGGTKELDKVAKLIWICRNREDKDFTGIVDIHDTYFGG